MIGLLQRVSLANVAVGGRIISAIGPGILVLVGMERRDDEARADRLLQRLLGYRVFADASGRMNLSVCDVDGALLLVPQFTLAANTANGMRASLTAAAAPEQARSLFDYLVAQARSQYARVETGVFGADMKVSLTNDGPVTFWLKA
ncbi:MAG: D-aminoacyl-tRNA deacylase [Acidiferrobacterales bacterium]